jgi:hypothetical protein
MTQYGYEMKLEEIPRIMALNKISKNRAISKSFRAIFHNQKIIHR